jgi:hypothetical protein
MSVSTISVSLRARIDTILAAWSAPAYVTVYAPNEEGEDPTSGRVSLYWTVDAHADEQVDFAGGVAATAEIAFEMREHAQSGLELWRGVRDSLMAHLRTYRNSSGTYIFEAEDSDEFRDGAYLTRVIIAPVRHEEAA